MMTDELAGMDIPVSKSVVTPLESNGSRVAKKHPASVISQQLREELIRILQTGDLKNDGAFTVAIAAHVEKFAVAAREILMTENLAQNDLASLMMMRKQHLGGPWSSLSLGGGGFVGEGLSMPVPITNNENFGVQAIRQIIDAARTMGESPAKLVEALAIARTNNLVDVVAVLEKKLGMSKEEPALEDEASKGQAS